MSPSPSREGVVFSNIQYVPLLHFKQEPAVSSPKKISDVYSKVTKINFTET
jgi:hypothetical protein